MSMFVKKSWSQRAGYAIMGRMLDYLSWRYACADVRLARRNVKMAREKITVCRQRLDYDAERPNACLVKYNTVAFPWVSKSHPAEDTEFISVCSHIGNDGLCNTDESDRCQMLQNRIDYELAVEDLESVLAIRRERFRGMFGLQK
ncbi:MAG: hypothetical protein IJL21_02425 [Alphaproteobacteria bacterium]|nr:hypothetical protein [Alphaproteobacteria bacterium]